MKYYYLQPNDKICKGDEIKEISGRDDDWCPCWATIGYFMRELPSHYIVRRPIRVTEKGNII